MGSHAVLRFIWTVGNQQERLGFCLWLWLPPVSRISATNSLLLHSTAAIKIVQSEQQHSDKNSKSKDKDAYKKAVLHSMKKYILISMMTS